MGPAFLIVAFLIVSGFTVYCIYTKSYQRKIRNYIYISMFAVFVIFATTAVVQWGFRWYGLAMLLLISAVSSGLSLIHSGVTEKPVEKGKEFKNWRILLESAGMLLLVVIALIPVLIFPDHELIKTTGEHQIATAVYTFTDQNRIETYSDTGENRKLNVEFWYPSDINTDVLHTLPLVVFSHGSFGVRTSNESLFNELASHGYVVSSVDHTYQSLFTSGVDDHKIWIDMGYMKEVNDVDAHTKKQQASELFHKWMKIRTEDINFVIDTILGLAENNASDPVFNLIDTTNIGVMGHSLGGSAALGIGRIRDDVSAVIALESPFLYDITGVEKGEFVFLGADYPIPVLNIYSDASWSHLSEWTQYAENYKLLSKTEVTAFNVYISGAGHLSLTDLALTSPVLTRLLNQQKSSIDPNFSLKTINKICLEFFNSYLKGMGSFSAAGKY